MPDPVALVLTHPDGTHTLTVQPSLIEARRIGRLAVIANKDAHHALAVDHAGQVAWQLNTAPPAPSPFLPTEATR